MRILKFRELNCQYIVSKGQNLDVNQGFPDSRVCCSFFTSGSLTSQANYTVKIEETGYSKCVAMLKIETMLHYYLNPKYEN